MAEDKFENPQAEALEIALAIRRKLLDGKEDIISVLRNCLVVAMNLSREKDMLWIKNELGGVFDTIPSYRILSCPHENTNILKECKVALEIKLLCDFANANEDIYYEGMKVRPIDTRRIIDGVTNKCLYFLNDCIPNLLYCGYVQSFFDKIRKQVDEKLTSIDSRIPQELQSMYINLRSQNPADWPKVAHSCRRILKFLADKVFPAQEQKYTTKNGHEWDVKDNNFRNRLLCFLDKNSASDVTKSECEIMEKYFKDVTEETQDGVHNDLSNYDASMIAIHTYLIVSEVLNKLPSEKPVR